MRVSDLQRLYDYNYWANRKLFDVISQMTPEQFTDTVAGSYGSVRNTIVHIMSAEWGWLERAGGPKRGEKLEAEDFPTVDSVVQTWDRVERSMREFLLGLSDEDLSRDIEFTLWRRTHSLPLGDMLHHAAIHAVHHRGQVAVLLRTLGYVPPTFDFLFYLGEK